VLERRDVPATFVSGTFSGSYSDTSAADRGTGTQTPDSGIITLVIVADSNGYVSGSAAITGYPEGTLTLPVEEGAEQPDGFISVSYQSPPQVAAETPTVHFAFDGTFSSGNSLTISDYAVSDDLNSPYWYTVSPTNSVVLSLVASTPTPAPMCYMYGDTGFVKTRGRSPSARSGIQSVPGSSPSEVDPSDIPVLNQEVVDFARQAAATGEKVGDGQCSNLAEAALMAANAKIYPPHGLKGQMGKDGRLKADPNENYQWGTLIARFTPGNVGGVTNLLPGDILQFRNVQFDLFYAEQHTAIVDQVETVGANTFVHILEQHTKGELVTARTLDFSEFRSRIAARGAFVWAYRPQPATP
jgi:hypothetical protein